MLRTQAHFARALPRSAALAANAEGEPIPEASVEETSNDPKTDAMRNCSALAVVGGKLTSMVDAFAVIRAIEQRYGTIREFSFTREYTSFNQYNGRIYLVFNSAESRTRIPQAGGTITIPAPREDTLEAQPGGPSLSDIQGFLSPKDVSSDIPEFGNILDAATSEESAKDTKKQRMIQVTLHHGRREFYTPSAVQFGMKRGTKEAAGRSMLNWGGFYPLQPIQKGSSLEYGASTHDHLRMRRLLRKWSEFTEAPNPFEVSSVTPPAPATPSTPPAESPPQQASSHTDTTPIPPASNANDTRPPKPTEWENLPSEIADNPLPDSSPVETPANAHASPIPRPASRTATKLRPSTDHTFGLSPEALMKASESLRASSASSRGDSAGQPRKRERKPKATPPPPKDKSGSGGFSERLKSFIGSWF
ncbi:hypothetical protein ONZ45_g3183 [Pleurotus djamor]|nr:hypothetical protein ONZ45_g3183 [Pleurotus djamor]